MPRPLMTLTISYAAGIIAARTFHLPPWLLAAALVLFLAAFIYNYFWAWQKNRLYLYFFLAILGMFMLQWQTQRNEGNLDRLAGRWVMITGTVSEAPEVRTNRVDYVLKAEKELTGQGTYHPLSGSVLISVYGRAARYAYGDRLVLAGTPELPKGPGNPGEFDYRQYLKDRGIQLLFRSPQGTGIKNEGRGMLNPLTGMTIWVRDKLVSVLDSVLPEKQAGFMQGLLFGSRGRLDYEIRDDFALAGVMHVLSVSGYHVGLVVGFLLLLGRLLHLSKNHLYLLILGVTAFYALMTGASPPVVRAVIMTWFIMFTGGGEQKGSRSDGFSLAALAILILDPGALFSIGFQLSFTAVWGILFLAPHLRRLANGAAAPVIYIIAVQIAVLPVLVYYFNLLSLVSLPANLVIVPIVSLIMLLGWFAVLAGVVWLPAAFPATFGLNTLLNLVFWAADKLTGIPYAAIALKSPSSWQIVCYYAVLIFLLKFASDAELSVRVRRIWTLKKPAAILAGLALVLVIIWAGIILPEKKQLEINFLDVGQGDSAVIASPRGRHLLIDAGGTENPLSTYRPGENVVIPFLRRQGIDRLEMLVLSHAHADHFQGAWAIAERIGVNMLVVNRNFAENPDGSRLIDIFRANGTQIKFVSGGERITFGENIILEVLNPQSNSGTNENDNSMILRLVYNKFNVLFTGDAEEELLTSVIKNGKDIRSEIIKVPHHGSINGWLESLYLAAEPSEAVISVGRNSFGHPSGDVLAGLARLGISIYRTDRHGAVTVRSDGQGYRLQTVKRID